MKIRLSLLALCLPVLLLAQAPQLKNTSAFIIDDFEDGNFISKPTWWRFGGLYNEREGYVDNNYTGEDHQYQENWSLTSALRWQPSENLDVIWRLDYDEIDQDSKAVTSDIIGMNGKVKSLIFKNTKSRKRNGH